MIKKLGVVTVGVTAGLMAAAPFASATESHHDGDHHGPAQSCELTGGDSEAAGAISGDALVGNLLAQAPIGGNNLLNIACDNILNDNVNGNHIGVDVL